MSIPETMPAWHTAQVQCKSPVTFGATAAVVKDMVCSKQPGICVVLRGSDTNPRAEEEVWLDRPQLTGARLHWGRSR